MTIDASAESTRSWWLGAAAVPLAVAVAVVWWPGCRQYPAVTSEQSLGLMKLLYAACNTKDPARLAKVERGVEQAVREGKMSPAEQQAFGKILALAKESKWPEAEAAALRFARDQVGVGHPAPEEGKKAPPKRR